MNSKLYQKDAGHVFDSVLQKDEMNYFALYGKSLILYSQGKIEESGKILSKLLDQKPLEAEDGDKVNVDIFRERLVELLESKPPTKVVILDELQKKYDDIYQESFLINFMTIPKQFKNSRLFPKVLVKSTRESTPPPQPSTLSVSSKVSSSSTPPAKKQNDFFCIICNKGFSKMFSLNRHMLVHSGIKNHSCIVCSRSFVQKSDMVRHEATHKESYEVICTFAGCEKRFKSKKNMRSHLLTHSTERPFECAQCCKAFKTPRMLRVHESLHLKLMPFICDICGRGFPVKAYLKSHMISHLNIAPFFCAFCPASYKRNNDLSYHVKIHHKSQHVTNEDRPFI